MEKTAYKIANVTQGSADVVVNGRVVGHIWKKWGELNSQRGWCYRTVTGLNDTGFIKRAHAVVACVEAAQ